MKKYKIIDILTGEYYFSNSFYCEVYEKLEVLK